MAPHIGAFTAHKSARVAGNKLDEAISNYIKKHFNLLIGERMAEDVKIQIGAALPPLTGDGPRMEVRGRDAFSGLPRLLEITAREINLALQPPLTMMLSCVKSILEETPPELASDIIDKGMVLAGGTSQLRGLDKFFTQGTGVPAAVAEEPLLCVVKGTGVAIENLELYKRSIVKR